MKNTALLLLFVTIAASSQWLQVSNGMPNRDITSLAVKENYIFAGTYEHGIYLSVDNGMSWSQTSINNQSIYRLASNEKSIFAATGAGIYSSSDNGKTWSLTSFNNPDIYSLAVHRDNIFAGTLQALYLSSNNGLSWAQTTLNDREIISLAVNENANIIFAGTHNHGIYLSSDNGATWIQTSLNKQIVYSMALEGSRIFAGTSNGVYYSSDNGASWTQTSLSNLDILSITVFENYIFASDLNSYTVFVSNDNGANWMERNEGLPIVTVRSFCILNDHIFAGTWISGGTHHSVYRRPLSELIGIQPISAENPDKFSLSQNYPNPFNPTTNIEFSIPKAGLVNLTIYDALGNTVEVLQSGELKPGTYKADWNAASCPSGIYFYKLIAGDFTETRKMVLIK